MTYAEKFDLIEQKPNVWELHVSGSPAIAGRLEKLGKKYRLIDSQEHDLGTFDTQEHALRVLYGSD